MAGFYAIFSSKNTSKNVYRHFSNHHLENAIQDEIISDKYVIGRSILNKLTSDKLFFEDEKYILVTDGVLFEKKISAEVIISNFEAKGTDALKFIDGNVSGLLFDKQKKEVFVFNDHLATRSIFYYFHKEFGFIVCSEFQAISKILKENNLPYNLDKSAAYSLMLYGHLLEDTSLIKEVKRLKYSSILHYQLVQNELSTDKYFNYKVEEKHINQEDAIEKLDKLFTRSVKKTWHKDIQNNSEHLSLLSGGMDAKTNVLIAKESGFKNISTYTFGQSTSQDVIIAKEVAAQNGFNHQYNFLDDAAYLNIKNYKQYVSNTDGLVLLQGSAHMQSSMDKLNLKPYSVLHTGQIGDALFGSFTNTKSLLEIKRSIGYVGKVFDERMLENIDCLDDVLKRNNASQELFVYEQRIINAAIMGDRSLYNIIDSVSPFYDLELIKFMQSVPQALKTNDKLYFNWLAKKHPQVLNHKWEKIDMKPNHPLKVKFGKTFKRYVNGARKYFNFNYDSMNPFSKWLTENPEIISNLKTSFYQEIENLEIGDTLKKDMITVFENDVFEYRNKFSVYTLVLALKLHFSH